MPNVVRHKVLGYDGIVLKKLCQIVSEFFSGTLYIGNKIT